jgi:ketosteroid isomerase-like protein
MKKTMLPAFILMLLFSCDSGISNRMNIENIMRTDRHYSAISAEDGMNASFLSMFDSSGTLLRRNHYPVEGIQAIRKLLLAEEDTSFTLTWEPVKAVVAQSGELGYSYGIYLVTSQTTHMKIGEGTYATIWKKDRKGDWKAVLDTGNPGLKAPADTIH